MTWNGSEIDSEMAQNSKIQLIHYSEMYNKIECVNYKFYDVQYRNVFY